jgi:hypothetical protein
MLQHVTLEVTPAQVRDCVAFWELLGFAEVTPPPLLRDRFTWVEREGTNAWDAPRSFVRDPAGHLVEVMSRPPQPPWPGE